MDIGPPADEFQTAIQQARADLTAAGEQPPMNRDPYRIVLRALADTLSIFGRSITRWERATAAVVAAQSPLSEAERAALRAEIVDRVEDGAYRGMRIEAARVVRTIDRALSVKIGLMVGCAFVLGCISVFGFLSIASLGQFSPTAQQQAAWASIIESNPDPRPALASAEIRADQSGRRYYAKLSLWLDPAPPAPKPQ